MNIDKSCIINRLRETPRISRRAALDGLAGVLLGDFSGCVQHPDQGYEMDSVFADFFRQVGGASLPVTVGWPVGHAEAPHLSLPMGASAELVAEPETPPELRVSGSACEDGAC